MKKLYKVGYNYFSELRDAERWIEKSYTRTRPGLVEVISVDNVDLNSDIYIRVRWTYHKNAITSCNIIHIKYPSLNRLKENVGLLDIIPDNYGDTTIVGTFKFDSLKKASKVIRGEYTIRLLEYLRSNNPPKKETIKI